MGYPALLVTHYYNSAPGNQYPSLRYLRPGGFRSGCSWLDARFGAGGACGRRFGPACLQFLNTAAWRTQLCSGRALCFFALPSLETRTKL